MSSCSRFCFVEDHNPYQVFSNSAAHGPTTRPSTLSVASVASSVMETFITGFVFLHGDCANRFPKSRRRSEVSGGLKSKELWESSQDGEERKDAAWRRYVATRR